MLWADEASDGGGVELVWKALRNFFFFFFGATELRTERRAMHT